MQTFLNLKLRTKLMVGFTVVLALPMFLGIFSLFKLAGVRATTVDMAENWLPSIRTLADMRNELANVRRAQYRMVIAKNEEGRTEPKRAIETGYEAFKKYDAEYMAMISSPEEKQLYETIEAARDEYSKSDAVVDQFLKQGNSAGATDYVMAAQKGQYEKASSAIDDDIKFNNDGANTANKLGAQLYASARWGVIGAMICSVAIGIVLALTIAGLISRPVQEVREVAQRIASGDLTG